MRNRYQKPADPPNPAFLQAYLCDARPTLDERLAEPDAAEARRVEGVAALLALARAELAKAGDPNRLLAMPFQLRQFLTIEGLRILTADDPVAALRRLLGHKAQRRGRPAEDNDYRDLMIATDVAELHANGMALTRAFDEVSKRPGTPGVKHVEAVYFGRDDLAVRVELEWRQPITAGHSDNPPPEIEGREITRAQWEQYSALAAAECPQGHDGRGQSRTVELHPPSELPGKNR
jgi:hypothetical protein